MRIPSVKSAFKAIQQAMARSNVARNSNSMQSGPDHSELASQPVKDIPSMPEDDDQDLDSVASDTVDNTIVSRAPRSEAF